MDKVALKKTARDAGIVGALGILYYVWIRLTHIAIPCVLHEVTGLQCPSCGITRMFVSLFSLDFKAAFHYNQLLFFIWPVVGYEILYLLYKSYAKKDIPLWNYILAYSLVGFSVIFGIIRNVVL